MKTLSIRQPWAWLIVHGYKPIENRTWGTPFRGDFFVHAGLTFDHEGYNWVRETFPNIPMPQPNEFERGGIVGKSTLVDCVPPFSDLAENVDAWYVGEFGFLLKESQPLPFRALKGKLGFFDTPAE